MSIPFSLDSVEMFESLELPLESLLELMVWLGVLAHFGHFIMVKECSSDVQNPDFGEMKEKCDFRRRTAIYEQFSSVVDQSSIRSSFL